MSYVALYRKFRPQTFDQIKGQGHVVRALKNQLINNRIGHAYLFTGTRGTGKTSAAKIFAKAVNCLHPVNGEPCNECENCRSVAAGNFVDVVEVDAASNNGVDDIRRIIEEIRYTPVKGNYKVFIIDEAHMITGPAFNAFLKTLEEPPAYAVFILATTEPHKLPITILSRCQRYDFRRITTEQIAENLAEIVSQEGVAAEEKALSYIARIGDGSMRDSISLLDKCIAFNLGDCLTYENVLDTLGTVDTEDFSKLFRSVYSGDSAGALKIIDRAVAEGRDLTQFTTDLIWYIRNILMVKAAPENSSDLLGLSAENMEQLTSDAGIADSVILMRYIRILSELINQIRFSASKQVLLEVAVIKLACPQMETDVESLADRIRQLEARPMNPVPQKVSSPAYQQPMYSQPDDRPASAPAVSPELSYSPVSYEEADDEDFFGGLGPISRMSDPDVFSDLLDEDVTITYEGTGEEESLPEMAAPQPTHVPQDMGMKRQEVSPGGDLKGIWPQVLSLCDSRLLKVTLNKCKVNQTGNDTLVLEVPGAIGLKQLKDEENLAYINEITSQAAGRKVSVQVVLAGTFSGGSTKADFPEELLNNINFNIGTEER